MGFRSGACDEILRSTLHSGSVRLRSLTAAWLLRVDVAIGSCQKIGIENIMLLMFDVIVAVHCFIG